MSSEFYLAGVNIATDNASAQPPNAIGLSQLAVGARARVLGYRASDDGCDDDYTRRLQSLGLTPGTELVLRRYAPLGDPAEILFRGTRVAIRPAEAECLLLQAL